MGKDMKKKFTVSLDITTQDAEKQLNNAAQHIKATLQDIAKNTKNAKYFSGVMDQIMDIDDQMSQLSAKYGNDFTNMFSQIGSSMQESFSSVIDQTAAKLQDLQTKLNDLQDTVTPWKSISAELQGISSIAHMSAGGQKITGFKTTKEEVQEFYNIFDSLIEKKKVFESSGDFSSLEYIKNYIQLMKTASSLIQADKLAAGGKSMGVSASKLYDKADYAKQVLQGMFNGNQQDKGSVDYVQSLIEAQITATIPQIEALADAASQELKHLSSEMAKIFENPSATFGVVAEGIADGTDQVVKVIDIAKAKIVAAWKDYFTATEAAKAAGVDLEDGDYSSEMYEIQENINKMLQEWNAQATKGKWTPEYSLDLSGYIIDGDITFEDIEKEIDQAFEDSGITVNIPLEHISLGTEKVKEQVSTLGDTTDTTTKDMASDLDTVEEKTQDVISTFQELINYISKSGLTPKAFFKSLESGILDLDDELKGILTSLDLLDADGKTSIASINAGATNKGGMLSDNYTLIAREAKKAKYSFEAQPKLLAAQQMGANVGAILGIYEDEVKGLVYELQNTVKGKGILDFKKKIVNTDFLQATDEQVKKLIEDLLILQKTGLYIDWNGDNIFYDKDEGFSFIDLASKSTWFTASEENSVQENIEKFFDAVLNMNPQIALSTDYMHHIQDLIDETTQEVSITQNAQEQKIQLQNNTQSLTTATQQEEAAHQSNAAAIQAENDAIQAQIELKKKAQSMAWEQFAIDQSVTNLKSSAGIHSLSEMENYWKNANYDKKIDYYELTPGEAKNIIDKYVSKSTQHGWYSSNENFKAKKTIINSILGNDELRNAAMNHMFYLYKDYMHDAESQAMNFEDFLDHEFTLYRGDEDPVIYDPGDHLSFSFKESKAKVFDNYVESISIKPRDLIGSANNSTNQSELEIFVPSDKLPSGESSHYVSGKFQSFAEYYNQLDDKMKTEVDKRLARTEKQRIEGLLGDNLVKTIDGLGFVPGLDEFSQGIIPDSLALTGDMDIDDFVDTYNALSDTQKKLVAYYTGSVLPLYEQLNAISKANHGTHGYSSKSTGLSSEVIGETRLLDAIVNDNEGYNLHLAALTDEAKFNLFGDGEILAARVEEYKKTTDIVKQEIQNQNEQQQNALKSDKQTFSQVLNKVKDIKYDSETWGEKYNDFDTLINHLQFINDTENDPNVSWTISDGDYQDSYTGELLSYLDLLDMIEEFEAKHHENLQFVKDYIQKEVFAECEADINGMMEELDTEGLDSFIDQLSGSGDTKPSTELNAPKIDINQILSQIDNITDDAYNTLDMNKGMEFGGFYHDLSYVGQTLQHPQYSHMIDEGKYFNDVIGAEFSVEDLNINIWDLEQKYGEDLSFVKDYLNQVFAKYYSSLEQAANILIDNEEGSVQEALNKTPIDFAEVNAKLNEATLNAHENQLVDLLKISDDAYSIYATTQKNNDIIDSGEFVHFLTGEVLEYADLADAIEEYEVKYGENLQYVKDYLHQVFEKYLHGLDVLLGKTPVDDLETGFKLDDSLLLDDFDIDADVDIDDSVSNLQKLKEEYENQSEGIKQLIDNFALWYQQNIGSIDGLQEEYHQKFDGIYYPATWDFGEAMFDTPSFNQFLSEHATGLQPQLVEAEQQLEIEQQITAEKQKQDQLDSEAYFTEKSNIKTEDIQQETLALDDLLLKVRAVEQAIQDKTQAFVNEGIEAEQAIQQELISLSMLVNSLDEILAMIHDINQLSIGIDVDSEKLVEDVKNIALDTSLTSESDPVNTDYALENTLLTTNDILSDIFAAMNNGEYISKFVAPLNDAITELKNVANGIVQYQKASKSNTSVADARIANANIHDQIRDIALNAVSGRVIDGGDSQVTGMTAMANGIVKVTGYVQTATDAWEGFTLQVNEANEVSKLAFDVNAKTAKDAAKAAELAAQEAAKDVDANLHLYDKAEVEARAQKHIDEYTAQGKIATVQFKDSGRYTITILEEIDGLSKEIFQTFDENDAMIERTTATISNKQKIQLENLKTLISAGANSKLINDDDVIYQQYKLAAAELENMNQLYKNNADLSDDDILQWNAQIKLVQQLGTAVEKVINKRKTLVNDNVFKSDRDKKLATFNLDKTKLAERINIPDSFIQKIQDAGDAIKNAIDDKALKAAVNNWSALKAEIEQTAIEQDLYIKQQTKIKNPPKKSVFGSTVAINATAKFNTLQGQASREEFTNSQSVTKALEEYTAAYNRLIDKQKELAQLDDITDAQKAEFKQLTTECNQYGNALKKIVENSIKLWSNDVNGNPYALGDDFTDDKSGRQAALTEFINQLNGVDEATIKFDDNFTKCIYTINNGDGTFTKMTATFDEARTHIVQLAGDTEKATSGLAKMLNMFKGKLTSVATYLFASLSIQDAWQQVRKGIEYVREIDKALTELKKVTDETDASYEKFLQDMSKAGSVIGATVSDLTTMAAEWARLGYSMEEAGKLAESTAILLNVSEFEDATKASEALISTMQAFQYTADESQHVVDILNEVGNNYAVSSDGIATALQDSASALMEGGNNLEQATALVAAANRVVQDPSSVGSALRTISLRLRGTSVEVLEEMGEETDGVIESISKMQEKIKALTGVDILTDSGAYKDTYTILKEIGQVWEDMSDIDQAAALELMAGKNRANTLSAILSNMEDLEGAYESAMNAEGSALKENAAYLDSIQGRIDLFTNSLQTMWMNALDSDWMKGIVDFGTSIIKVVDKLGLFETALMGVFSYLSMSKKHNLDFASILGIHTVEDGWFSNLKNQIQESADASKNLFSILEQTKNIKFEMGTDVDMAQQVDLLNSKLAEGQESFVNYVSGLGDADIALKAYAASVKDGSYSLAGFQDFITQHNAKVKASGIAAKAAAVGHQLLNAAISMGVSLLISGAISVFTKLVNVEKDAAESAREAADASKELRDEFKSLDDYKEQIRDLRKELDSNTLSEADAYDAREKLLAIQNELIDKFGLEKDGINLVTGAINEQIAAIDALSQKEAQQWLYDNQKEINKAIEFFEDDKQGGKLDSFWENNKTSITNWGSSKNVSNWIDEYVKNRDHMNTWTYFEGQDINFTGSVEEVKTEVEDFQKWLDGKEKELTNQIGNIKAKQIDGSLGYSDSIATNILNSLNKDLKQLQDIREKIGKESKNWFGSDSLYASNKALMDQVKLNTARTDYADQYMAILEAENDFAEAQAKGDQEGVKQALDTINAETSAAVKAAEANGQSYMVNFFNGMQDEYSKLSKELNLAEGLSGNLKTAMGDILSGLDGMNAQEILQLKDIELTGDFEKYKFEWDALNQIANEYDMTIEDLIDALVRLGYIQSDFTKDVEKAESAVASYNALLESIDQYHNIVSETSDIIIDNTEVTEEYKESLKTLGISEEDLAECFYDANPLIVKNAKLLNNLVKSTNKNIARNAQLAKSQAKLQYYELYKKMAKLVNANGVVADSNKDLILSYYEEMKVLENTIAKYAKFEAQLLGNVTAYEEFQKAQETDTETDPITGIEEMAVALGEAFNTAELGTETARAAISGLVPESVYQDLETVDEKMAAIYDYFKNGKLSQYIDIAFDEEGNIEQAEMKLGNLRKFIEDGLANGTFAGADWQHFEFSDTFLEGLKTAEDKLQYFADQFGVTKDVAFAVIESINDHDVEWLNGDYGNLFEAIVPDGIEDKIYKNTSALAELNAQVASGKIDAEEYAQKYQELTSASDELGQQARDNISQYQDLTNQINDQKTKIDEYTAAVQKMKDQGKSEEEIKASVEYQSLIEASGLYTELIQKRSLLSAPTELLIQFAIDNIDQEIAQIESDLKDKIDFGEDGKFTVKFEAEFTEEDLEKINKYKQLWEEKHELELETDPEETKTALEEIESSAQNALDVINAIDGTTITINTSSAVSNVTKLTDALKTLAGVSHVDIQTSHMEPQKAYTETRSDSWLKKHYAMVDGTAHASGDWGLPTNEHNSLVGELGTEMVVDPHTGRYYTVGDNGAEMVDLPKDAIIFNHRQTEELLKNGHINSRGKAYAEGNAHVDIWPNGSSTTQWDDTGYSSWDDPTYELSEALDSAADSVGEFEETIDWIAIRMEEHDEKIGLLSAELENANTYIDKNAKIDEIISANNKKLRDLNKAYNYYSTHAEQYLEGMDSVLADAARNGEIAITEFTKEQDEATVNAINNYREFSKLAAEAYQEMEEIRSQIKDLDRQQFDNILNSVNLKTDIEDAQTGMLQDRVDLIETKGEPVPAEYYIGMKENSNQKLKDLTDARSKLDQDIVDKIANVEGFYGSDDYHEMLADLYAIQGEIDAATLELEEFQNAINDIYWDNFDELINRLDYLRNETESLIELMSHDDMFVTPEGETYEGGTVEFWRPEDVTWTNEGIATMGLYAQQMEIAEYTSKQYAEAIDELNAQYNAGLISESEYLAQLDELKKKQYESIEAYHEAKDAIVDLVKARVDAIKDGIKAEIDAYSELIEKQKEALESEKDLYDFEKSIQESEKEISEIKRKLIALENDDSMAAAAERKKLEAELAEAEYELEEKYTDRSYENKQEAFDQELEDFTDEKNEEIKKWEEYLENVDAILTDCLNIVQENATGVYNTLQTKADEYGITLNETVLSPWKNAELAIGDYSIAFDGTVSSNLEQLKLLKEAWHAVIEEMSAAASGYANDVSSGGYWSSSASDGVGAYDDAPTGPTVTFDDTPSEDPVGNDTPSSSTTISNGDTVTVDPNATNFSRDGGNGTKMASFVPGSSYTVYGTSGNEVLIGRDGVYTGWVNKDDLVGHATGTTGVKDDELAWIDELGEELVLHADGNGRLSYLTKGTAVIPHDISENLMQLGQLDPSDVLARNTPQIGISPSVVNNTIELTMEIGEVVHIDEVTKDTIPDLTKAIEKQLDKYMKQLNGQIRKYSR